MYIADVIAIAFDSHRPQKINTMYGLVDIQEIVLINLE